MPAILEYDFIGMTSLPLESDFASVIYDRGKVFGQISRALA
jgi:hypothetical protein